MSKSNDGAAEAGKRAGLVRKVASGAVSMREGMNAMAGRLSGLKARVDALEQEMQEQRALSLRVAQLTDIVQELLIPVADRDEQRLRDLLDSYAKTL